MINLLILSIVCSSFDLYDKEISKLQSELKSLTRARDILQNKEPLELLTVLPYTDEKFNLSKFVPKFVIKGEDPIIATQFISLKPMPGILHSSNTGILIAYSSGILELREFSGTLLYKIDLGLQASIISATTSLEEIRFALLTPKKTLEIYSVIIEKPLHPIIVENLGPQTTKVFISLYKESETELEENPTSLLFYVKSGKKYWVIGDEKGFVSFYSFSGKKESSNNLGIGSITALERYGPQMYVSSESELGVLNVNTLEVQLKCGIGGKSIVLDSVNTTSIVYTVTNSGIAMFNTRDVKENSFVCTEIARIPSTSSKILSTKDFLIGWGGEKIEFFDPATYELVNTLSIIESQGIPILAYFRVLKSGYYISFSQGKELHLFEILQAIKSESTFDFGSLRYLL